jgi:hypothetical protein
LEIKRIEVQGQPRKKLVRPPPPISTNKPGTVVHVCDPSYLGEAVEELKSGASLQKLKSDMENK